MAQDFTDRGAFNVDGQWATAIRYEAKVDRGAITDVWLTFTNGRSEVAGAVVSAKDARQVLGDTNYAAIETAVMPVAADTVDASYRMVNGQLRGKGLAFRRATLPGHAVNVENTIEPDAPVRSAADALAAGPADSGAAATPTSTTASIAAGPPSVPLGDRSTDVPDFVAQRFRRVDDSYYFPDRSLAFRDEGARLRSASNNLEVVRGLVAIAQARGWESIKVSGAEGFRREVWREASLGGMEVRGYEPSEPERVALRALAQRTGREGPPRSDPPAAGPGRNASPGISGELVEHGPAPYRFDPAQGLSYFVKLRTEAGERVLWGTDLERAIVESRTKVKAGDAVILEPGGSTPVTVKSLRRDESGKVLEDARIATHRNAWTVEKASYFEERAARAEAFRQNEADPRELARRHPDLNDAIVGLWLGERFARRMIERPEDRDRAMALVKQRLVEALERGQPINAPRLKAEVARELHSPVDDATEAVRASPSRSRHSGRPPRDRVREEPVHARE